MMRVYSTYQLAHQHHVLAADEKESFWDICETVVDVDALVRVLEYEVAESEGETS